MTLCYCKYNQCSGANVPARTQRDHAKRDRVAALRASLGHRTPSNRLDQSSVPAPNTPFPAHPSHPLRVPRLLPPASEPPHTPPMHITSPTQTPSSPCYSSIDAGRLGTELQECATAEERGRNYEEHTNLFLDHLDDLGDLNEVEDSHQGLETDLGQFTETSLTNMAEALGDCGGVASSHIALDALPLRTVPTSDPRYPGENTPDPFKASPDAATVPSARQKTASTPLYILYMLVAWLHTQYQLAFKACDVMLVVISHILAAACQDREAGCQLPQAYRASHEAPYASLTSVITHLGVEPDFQVLPVCPRCSEPHPSGQLPDALCIRCSAPLFKHTGRHNQRQRHTEDILRPHLQYPHMGIEDQLRTILEVPGMEDEMEQWRFKSRMRGKYNDMFDGRVPRDIKGPDGRPFFENPAVDANELRVGLVLGFDW
jgi:hypothetical protein